MVMTSMMKAGATRTIPAGTLNKENQDDGTLPKSRIPVRVQPRRAAKTASRPTALTDKRSALSRLGGRGPAAKVNAAAADSAPKTGVTTGPRRAAKRVAGKVPDFSKLHQKEQERKDRLISSKARKVTAATGPKLSTSSRNIAGRRAKQADREESFKPRSTPPKRTASSSAFGSSARARPATASATSARKKKTEFKPFNLSRSNKKQRGSVDDDGFVVDPNALESILNEQGVDETQIYRRQTTIAATREEGEQTRAKRFSIFNGALRVPLKPARMTLAGGQTAPLAGTATPGSARRRSSVRQRPNSPLQIPADLVVTPRKATKASTATAKSMFTPLSRRPVSASAAIASPVPTPMSTPARRVNSKNATPSSKFGAALAELLTTPRQASGADDNNNVTPVRLAWTAHDDNIVETPNAADSSTRSIGRGSPHPSSLPSGIESDKDHDDDDDDADESSDETPVNASAFSRVVTTVYRADVVNAVRAQIEADTEDLLDAELLLFEELKLEREIAMEEAAEHGITAGLTATAAVVAERCVDPIAARFLEQGRRERAREEIEKERARIAEMATWNPNASVDTGAVYTASFDDGRAAATTIARPVARKANCVTADAPRGTSTTPVAETESAVVSGSAFTRIE